MKRLCNGAIIGISIGVIISIIFSLLFASGGYDPVNPHSYMGEIYFEYLDDIQIMIIAVCVWAMIGITFSLSTLIFTHLKYSRIITTILHFLIMLIIFFPLAILAGWFPFKVSAILIFFITFIVVYFIIWTILNKKNKKTINEINTYIKGKRVDQNE
ncbi:MULTISPECIES: DUF3021 domain-containing protein [Mammaliicoccus]|uniref:DUF3021 domain-containing protein n=1 Tax=Mammaliicoccus TaxID=2803850 RepID=UPI001EFB1149|nr:MULTISPECIES: DUF3021 domain-containing protein [Mammaliicoccus]MEB7781265.1 DUF3021 domain-containing protein [Mammaliicoccus fleurettii]MEB8067382.1 DUF3021 domain-containing protein [Mammaliicoccus fleurettii]